MHCRRILPVACGLVVLCCCAAAAPPQPTIEPLVRVVDLSCGESQEVTLCDGTKVTVKLLQIDETVDPVRKAVRQARAQVAVDGKPLWLTSANYRLPVSFGRVQLDCPVTKAVYRNNTVDAWGLEKDARVRLWPAGSPLMNPGTFGYPLEQRWLASSTQMANEPVYVDAGEKPRRDGKVYYHWGLDFGGCEGLTEVFSATEGLVVSSGKKGLEGYTGTPVQPRYDVVYVLDGRGWYYRYSHLHTIDEAITPGAKVKMGQKIGLLGKEGGSGGWTHLHFDIYSRQPSGKWGCQEAYAFAWEAYVNQYRPKLVALARPHLVTLTGEKVTLDGSRSWSAEGSIARYTWLLSKGGSAEKPQLDMVYERPGCYSEVLKVTDEKGRVDYDFAIVFVLDRQQPERLPPSVHVTYHPAFVVKPGETITFKARTFGTQSGEELWDFGDGSPPCKTKSDGNAVPLAKDGYVVQTHRYEKPGQYLVRVQRTDEAGQQGTGCVRVEVAEPRPTLNVWPGTAPGEKGEVGEEKLMPPQKEPKPIPRLTNVSRPTITVYKPEAANDTGAAVVICPGGGYNILAIGHEGEEVAEWLNSAGVTGIVLKYRVPKRKDQPKHLPPLQDAQRALSLVRAHAAQWKIDPQRIGILGFSAGGHLAAAAATNFDQRQYPPIDAVDKLSCRPDFAVLIYPAYLVEGEKLSPEIRVDKTTPPVFFVHAGDDRISPANSALMYLALKRSGVAAELHVYATGGHGFGLRPSERPCSKWPALCQQWMQSQGLLKPRND